MERKKTKSLLLAQCLASTNHVNYLLSLALALSSGCPLRLLPGSWTGKTVPQVEHSCKTCIPTENFTYNVWCKTIAGQKSKVTLTPIGMYCMGLTEQTLTSQNMERHTEHTNPRSMAFCTTKTATGYETSLCQNIYAKKPWFITFHILLDGCWCFKAGIELTNLACWRVSGGNTLWQKQLALKSTL